MDTKGLYVKINKTRSIIFNQRNIAAYENLFTKHLSEDIFHPKNRRIELKVKCQRYTYLIRSWRSLLPQAR